MAKKKNGSSDKRPHKKSGYGNPPKETRFKPGQSGNRRGRPKGSKSVSTALKEALKARIPVNEAGERKTITKEQALFIQLVNNAIKGDARAIALLLKHIDTTPEEPGSAERGASQSLEDLDRHENKAVIDNIVRRIQAYDRLPDPSPEPGQGSESPSGDPDTPRPDDTPPDGSEGPSGASGGATGPPA